jgi:hypothetical protein
LILNGQVNPIRFQRVFECETRISIQVLGPHTITLAREQGEATNPNDGIQLTQVNTSAPAQPYETWWKGELWFRSSIANGPFVMLILVEKS